MLCKILTSSYLVPWCGILAIFLGPYAFTRVCPGQGSGPLLSPPISRGFQNWGLRGSPASFLCCHQREILDRLRRLAWTQKLTSPGLTPGFLNDSHTATRLLGGRRGGGDGTHCLNSILPLSYWVLPGIARS